MILSVLWRIKDCSYKMMTRGLLVMSLLSLWVGWILADVSVQEDPLDDMDPAGNQMNLFQEQVAEDQDDDNGPRVGISVSRRSPLDKNFIRFGRFGPKLMPVDTLVDR